MTIRIHRYGFVWVMLGTPLIFMGLLIGSLRASQEKHPVEHVDVSESLSFRIANSEIDNINNNRKIVYTSFDNNLPPSLLLIGLVEKLVPEPEDGQGNYTSHVQYGVRQIQYVFRDTSRSTIRTQRKDYPRYIKIRTDDHKILQPSKKDLLDLKYFPVVFHLAEDDAEIWQITETSLWTDSMAIETPYVIHIRRRGGNKPIPIQLHKNDIPLYREKPMLLSLKYTIENFVGVFHPDSVRFEIPDIRGKEFVPQQTDTVWWPDQYLDGEEAAYKISIQQPHGYYYLTDGVSVDESMWADSLVVFRSTPEEPILLRIGQLSPAEAIWIDLSREPLNRNLLYNSVSALINPIVYDKNTEINNNYYLGLSNGRLNSFGRGKDALELAKRINTIQSSPTTIFKHIEQFYQAFIDAGMAHSRRDYKIHLVLAAESVEFLAFNNEKLEELLDKQKIKKEQLVLYVQSGWYGIDKLSQNGYIVRKVNAEDKIIRFE